MELGSSVCDQRGLFFGLAAGAACPVFRAAAAGFWGAPKALLPRGLLRCHEGLCGVGPPGAAGDEAPWASVSAERAAGGGEAFTDAHQTKQIALLLVKKKKKPPFYMDVTISFQLPGFVLALYFHFILRLKISAAITAPAGGCRHRAAPSERLSPLARCAGRPCSLCLHAPKRCVKHINAGSA